MLTFCLLGTSTKIKSGFVNGRGWCAHKLRLIWGVVQYSIIEVKKLGIFSLDLSSYYNSENTERILKGHNCDIAPVWAIKFLTFQNIVKMSLSFSYFGCLQSITQIPWLSHVPLRIANKSQLHKFIPFFFNWTCNFIKVLYWHNHAFAVLRRTVVLFESCLRTANACYVIQIW